MWQRLQHCTYPILNNTHRHVSGRTTSCVRNGIHASFRTLGPQDLSRGTSITSFSHLLEATYQTSLFYQEGVFSEVVILFCLRSARQTLISHFCEAYLYALCSGGKPSALVLREANSCLLHTVRRIPVVASLESSQVFEALFLFEALILSPTLRSYLSRDLRFCLHLLARGNHSKCLATVSLSS